jgi:glycerol-3-phosphate O-acyltransferase
VIFVVEGENVMAGSLGGRRGWLASVVLLFGVVVLVCGGVVPAARWFLRRRADGVAREVGRRGVGLPATRLTRRGTWIEGLVSDPEVLAAAEAYAGQNDVSVAAAMARVERYAREIAPSFNAFLYFRVGMPLAAWISSSLYDVRVDQKSRAALDEGVSRDASLVFVMNHRSNLDYVLLAHLMRHRTAISFAAGEWAGVWPLRPLIRGTGAFFVRRGSGDELYRRVLERFVQMAVEGGLTQAIFPEGGLSRDGRPREPKIGLLDYTLRRFDPGAGDIIFVPVGINYDWVLEDLSLLQPGGPDAGIKGHGGFFASTAESAIRNLVRARRGGSFRLGVAAVGFGVPVSAREYAAGRGILFSELGREGRIEEVGRFARLLMQTINEAIPHAAVPLVARALLEATEDTLSERELLSRAQRLARGERLDYEVALRTLVMRRLVLAGRDGYAPAPDSENILAYYANSAYR